MYIALCFSDKASVSDKMAVASPACSTMMCFIMLLLTLICCANAYKILIVFPYPIRSMNILGAGIAKHLSETGHEVTFVTAYPIKNEPEMEFRQIDIFKSVKYFSVDGYMNVTSMMENHEIATSGADIQDMHEYAIAVADAAFQDNDFRQLLNDPTEKFDVVLADLYESEIYSGLSILYDCPMIWSSSMGAQWSTIKLLDESTNPAYTSDYMSTNVPPLDFRQRLQELWSQIKGSYIKEFITGPKAENVFRKVFEPILAQRGKSLPVYKELLYNASIIFGNEHHAAGNIPSLPQNFKLVGGQHIERHTKALPQDLQSLMDKAKEGVIYFSLGSIWKSKDIPSPVKEGLVKVFGELKQTVIWKYEDDDLNALPKNLHIVKWAPQPSILDHQNCFIFVTHGGLLSSIEAVHYGVPIIAIPIFLDQFINSNRASVRGYGIKVDLSYNLAQDLKSAIQEMLTDQKYTAKVKELSLIYHDRPVSPGEELVHWVEHVVKTRGALHLRSPALNVPWYQKSYLDLIVIAVAFICIIKIAIKRFLLVAFSRQVMDLEIIKKKRQ